MGFMRTNTSSQEQYTFETIQETCSFPSAVVYTTFSKGYQFLEQEKKPLHYRHLAYRQGKDSKPFFLNDPIIK